MRWSSMSTTCLPPAVRLRGETGHLAVEVLLELREPLVERAATVVGLGRDALVEGVEIIAHGLGDVLGALAEAVDQFAAIGFHGAVELGRCGG